MAVNFYNTSKFDIKPLLHDKTQCESNILWSIELQTFESDHFSGIIFPGLDTNSCKDLASISQNRHLVQILPLIKPKYQLKSDKKALKWRNLTRFWKIPGFEKYFRARCDFSGSARKIPDTWLPWRLNAVLPPVLSIPLMLTTFEPRKW